MKTLAFLLTAVVLSAGIVLAKSGTSRHGSTARPMIPSEPPIVNTGHFAPPGNASLLMYPSAVGTLTSLGGYYDYQANGTPQYIRLDPRTGGIYVTYTVADDSAQYANSRGVAFAMSTDGGLTWNNFNQIRLPGSRRASFPSLDVMRGLEPGWLLADDAVPEYPNGGTIDLFVNGSGMSTPPLDTLGTNQPFWPIVAGCADGSVLVVASKFLGFNPGTLRILLTDHGWSDWLRFPGPYGVGGQYPAMATSTGLVGVMVDALGPYLNSTDGGVWLHESTDNGVGWGTPENVYPPLRIVGQDTFAAWGAIDFTYDGTNPLAAISESVFDPNSGEYSYDSARVAFWSRQTGVVTAVEHNPALFASDMNGHPQMNHLTVGGCAIAKSGDRIVIVFEGFQHDTAASGFRFCDLWMVQSANGGATWTIPIDITNTPDLDERFPSVSKDNQPGYVNMTWQEETQPGSYVIGDNNLPSVNWQKFLKYQLPPIVGVRSEPDPPASFMLSQNFPNPFNPITEVGYGIGEGGFVSIKVYDVLGREVRTLVDEVKRTGTYTVLFDGSGLASGLYFYKMTARGFSETKRMMLIK